MRRPISIFMAMAAMLSMQGQQAKAVASSTADFSKAVANMKGARGIKIAPHTNGSNPYKHTRTPKQNQRQKRKLLRQCPHMRRSKKNPL